MQAGSGDLIKVVGPASGEVLGALSSASPADVAAAATGAAAAQADWARRTPSERAAVLRRAGAAVGATRGGDPVPWLVREGGSIPPKAGPGDPHRSRRVLGGRGAAHPPGGGGAAAGEPEWSFARRRPAGVVSVIAPFNFPLFLAIRSVAPALGLGNAVLLKPDPRTWSRRWSLVRIFRAAGLPEGLLQLLPGGREAGEAAVTAPEVRVVVVHRIHRAGRTVWASSAPHLKRVHLELGGNNALIVLPGADLARAASAGAFGSFMHQGQICMTTGRHLVHESSCPRRFVDALARERPTTSGRQPRHWRWR